MIWCSVADSNGSSMVDFIWRCSRELGAPSSDPVWFDIIQSTLNQSKINPFVFIARGETARLIELSYIRNIVTRENRKMLEISFGWSFGER